MSLSLKQEKISANRVSKNCLIHSKNNIIFLTFFCCHNLIKNLLNLIIFFQKTRRNILINSASQVNISWFKNVYNFGGKQDKNNTDKFFCCCCMDWNRTLTLKCSSSMHNAS